MAGKREVYVPSMSDAAVAAKTGKDWGSWFRLLDAAQAAQSAQLDHRAIVAFVAEKHGAPRWWRQMIAVEYERARGLRGRNETVSGFSVSVSKTVTAGVPELYRATAQAAMRKRWFPPGAFALSSQTQDKYFRGSWNKTARLEFGFYAKGPGKAQIAVQISRLARAADVERERAAWKAALAALQEMVEAGTNG